MSRVLDKALHALLTNPVTGQPVNKLDRVMIFYSVGKAIVIFLITVALMLGMGPGQ